MQKWRLFGKFLALHAAVPRRRALSGYRIPQGQQDFRPRLFRRSLRRRPVRPGLPGGDVPFAAREPHRRAARPLVPRQPAVVLGARQSPRRALARRPWPWRPSPCHFALPPLLDIPKLAVSDYKGVAYARKFPDSQRVYERASPFGYLEVYSSSYLHFAPGLSDNAAFSLPKMPENAYLGMYIDGEGPSGIIRDLPAEQTVYYRFLPMVYPYLIKQAPDTFVVQFGGGISTSVALRSNSKTRHRGGGKSRGARRLPHRQGIARFHRRRAQQSQGARHRLRRPALSGAYLGALRRHRPEPRRFRRPVEPGRLRHRREVFLYARSDEQLHARAQGWRRSFGDDVEQGGAAEVGAQALHHHGRGRARGR